MIYEHPLAYLLGLEGVLMRGFIGEYDRDFVEARIAEACGSPAGSTTAWSPPPVFVRPELTVEVTFLGWEAGRLRHATLG